MDIDGIKGSKNKLNKKTIEIKDREGNTQKVNMSVFLAGMAMAADSSQALFKFDLNKDNLLDENEVNVLKKSIIDAAGRDKVLDDNEILKMFGIDENSNKAKTILNQFKTMVERQVKGILETTVKNNIGEEITSNFKNDGSGSSVTKNKANQIITKTYSKGHILKKTEIIDNKNGSKSVTEYTNNENGKPDSSITTITEKNSKTRTLNTTYTYNDKNQLTEEKTIEKGKTYTLPNGQTSSANKITIKQYEYDENGNISKLSAKYPDLRRVVSEFENGKLKKQTTTAQKIKIKKDKHGKYSGYIKDSTSITEYTYRGNGSKEKVIMHYEDSLGQDSNTVYNYDEEGKLSTIQKNYYIRGAYVEEKYEGANLSNRSKGGVASEIIEYEEKDKTKIKQLTVNHFDEDGILISDEVFDAQGNKIAEHDYSKLDGHFDHAIQKNRGDCYLLAAINSLAQTPEGEKMLQDTIKIEGNNFKVTFPGARIAKERLIADLKKKNPNFDTSKISIPDEYTITAEELKEAMKLAGVKYSIGDKDVLLLEVAYEKYRTQLAKTLSENKIPANQYLNGFNFSKEHLKEGDFLSGGSSLEATFILTGKQSEYFIVKEPDKRPVCYVDADFQMHVPDSEGNIKDADSREKAYSAAFTAGTDNNVRDALINKLIKDSADGKLDNYAASASFNVSAQEVNGKTIDGGGHALSIKLVTADKVVLSNPWAPEKDVVMSMDDFKKAVKSIQICEVKSTSAVLSVPEGNLGAQHTTLIQPPPVRQQATVQSAQSVPQNSKKRIVKEGEGYTAIIKEALLQQGIKVTPQNIIKAKAQFKALNPNAVHVYNGKIQRFKGNEFLYKGAEIYIPEFEKDENKNVR